MSYIDAGYAVALVSLSVYGGSLWLRRRRLERLAARVEVPPGEQRVPAATTKASARS
jgi:hypothetical protein